MYFVIWAVPQVFKIILFKTPKSCHRLDGGNIDLQKLHFWALYLVYTYIFLKLKYWLDINCVEIIIYCRYLS